MIEGQDDRPEEPVSKPSQFIVGNAERLGHFIDARDSTELACQLLLGAFQPPSQQANRARSPVGGSHRVEDRSPDSLGGEPFERHPPARVVAAGRFDQTERSGSGQFLPVYVAGKVHRHLEHHMFHQRQVRFDPSVELFLAQRLGDRCRALRALSGRGLGRNFMIRIVRTFSSLAVSHSPSTLRVILHDKRSSRRDGLKP